MKKRLLAVLMVMSMVLFAFSLVSAAAEEPVRIGLVSPQTGNYADHGAMERIGMKLAVEEFGGKVLGRPIELVEVDSETNPDVASRRSKRLVQAEGVKFMMGGVSSSVGAAIGAVAEETGALFIATNENSDTLTGEQALKHMFRVCPNMAVIVRGAANYVSENLGKKWYFITHDYSWGWSGTRWARNTMPEVGATEVGEVKVPMGTRDFSSYLLQVANSGAEVAVVTVGGFDGIALYKQMNEFGIFDRMKVWWTLADYPDAYALNPEQRGRYGGAEVYYKATPGLEALTAEMQEKFPDAPIPVIETCSYHGWLGMKALLQAIEMAGSTDVDAVIDAMEGMIIKDNRKPNPTYVRPRDHQFFDTIFFGQDIRDAEGTDITKIFFNAPAMDYARTKAENPVDLTKE